jgi:hypothetical protein
MYKFAFFYFMFSRCCSTCRSTLYIKKVFLHISYIYSLCFRELSNSGEAELVSQLTLGLLEKLGNQQLSIGIITPYHKQRTMIVSILQDRQVIFMKLCFVVRKVPQSANSEECAVTTVILIFCGFPCLPCKWVLSVSFPMDVVAASA